jgi:DNA repair protein RadB
MSKVSAGSYDLNKWLYGGYETDIVTVIYGGAGTGKTNFCLLAGVSQAKKGKKIIFIDTEGGFSVERIKQLF